MKVLLTGAAGYIGSTLMPKLLRVDCKVRAIDLGYFGLNHLRDMLPKVEFIRDDLTRVNKEPKYLEALLDGCDAIIHLAAMSNDPAADLDPALTQNINVDTTVTLANEAKRKNIRFVFASSCSVYGDSPDLIDESGARNPLTVYAKSKAIAEDRLQAISTKQWRPVILRFGTLFGFSPRMRFDLVVNIFSLFSVLKNEIQIFGTGDQWRPYLHVNDAARALLYFAMKKDPKHLIYNIATENLRVTDVVELLKEIKPGVKVVNAKSESNDKRDYRVKAEKMVKEGFAPRQTVIAGIEQIQDAILAGYIGDPESTLYQNVKWLKELGLKPERIVFLKAA